VKHAKMQTGTSILSLRGVHELDARPSAGTQTVSADSIDVVAMHLALIGIAVLLGFAVRLGLVAIEDQVEVIAKYGLFSNLPLFPFAMMGGAVLQKILQRFNNRTQLVDGAIMDRISGTALDFLIVAAMGTVSVTAIGSEVAAFVILCMLSLLWQLLCVLVISRFLFQQYPIENALPCFGQSTGVIASGLILLRMVDPNSRTGVASAFAGKQLIHSPIMGGGLWTALSIPLFRIIGIYGMLGVTTAITLLFLGISIYLRRTAPASSIELNDADFDDAAGALLLGARNDADDTDSVADDVTDFFSAPGLELTEGVADNSINSQ